MFAFMGLGPVELTICALSLLALPIPLLLIYLRGKSKTLAGEEAIPPRSLVSALFSFNGRIPRRAYWGLSFAVNIMAFAGLFVFAVIEKWIEGYEEPSQPTLAGMAMLLTQLSFCVAVLWVVFAILSKRCHDLNVSGLWSLAAFIPLFGGLWALIVLGCVRGTKGPNKYGADPT